MANHIDRKETNVGCQLCGSHGLWVFYEITNVPANCNLLWTSKDEAINCPKGNIKLAYCPSCSFVTNIALDPAKNQYGDHYDDSLFYSNQFQTFAKQLTSSVVQRYNLYDKHIIEIGGGKVNFINLLIELGNNNGLRIDPLDLKGQHNIQKSTQTSSRLSLKKNEVNFFFSYCELEHINYPKEFLNDLRKFFSYNSNTHFFFAVPNAFKDFQEGNFTNIIYEHVSYFSIPSLFYLFSSCGFDALSVTESKNEIFDLIYIDALPKSQTKLNLKPDPKETKDSITSFAEKTANTIGESYNRVKQLLNKGKRVFLWGAGSRGVTLLNILKNLRIKYAIDINPSKQGKYVPGTGQKIVAPKFLLDNHPDYIILSNRAYKNEIKQILEEINVKTEFIFM